VHDVRLELAQRALQLQQPPGCIERRGHAEQPAIDVERFETFEHAVGFGRERNDQRRETLTVHA
jgi:hypothetical protein